MRLRQGSGLGGIARYQRRRLAFERLENRELMAVGVSLFEGTPTITGEDDAENIEIVGTSRAGEIRVTGRGGTEVNDVENGSVTIAGVIGSLIVRLNGGNDVVSVDNVYLRESLSITTGDAICATSSGRPLWPSKSRWTGPGAPDVASRKPWRSR